MSTLVKYSAKNFRAIRDWIIVKNMEFSERKLSSGIVMPSDNRSTHGIRPRWGEVVAVGPEQTDVKVGQYVLVSHGRWTRAIQVQWDGNEEPINIQRIDNDEVLLVSDEPQFDDTFSEAQHATDHMSSQAKIHGSMHNSDTGSNGI
jgi:co-chaperonin GroES (HSP10)